MDRTNELAERLKEFLKDNAIDVKAPRERRIFARVKREVFQESLRYAVSDLGFSHLSTITGVDLGTDIELLYHLTREGSIVLSLAFKVPKQNPTIQTATNLIPGAVLYEREVHELLGVMFEGHPGLTPLVLPEGWPQDVYPLRKDRSFEELKKIGSKT